MEREKVESPVEPEESGRVSGAGAREVRAPLPLAGARLWWPRGAGPSDPGRFQDLPFFESGALRDLVSHVRSRPEGEVQGLLLGERRRCPVTDRRWLLVRETLPFAAREEAKEAGGLTRLEAAIYELRGHRAGRGGRGDRERTPVGWYRSHTLLGLFLSEPEARFHDRGFPDSWPFAVVLGSSWEPPAVVFRRESERGARRTVRIPFYELLEEDGSEEGAGPRRADGPVASERAGPTWRDYAPEPFETDGSAAGAEDAGGAGGDGPVKEGREGGDFQGREDLPVEDLPVGDGEGAGAGEPPRPRPHRPGPGEEIPLLLPPEPEGRLRLIWWRWRTPILALLAVALLAVGAWVVAGVLGDEGGGVPVESRSPAAERFTELHGDLRSAIEEYRRVDGRFDGGEVGCPALGEAYLALDRAFLELASHVSASRESLGRIRLARYEAAASAVSDLDRDYQASGCPRPG